MLVIRLTRKGKKNQPFFRVVVVDKRRSAKGGRAVEELGYVDPLTKRKSFKKERVLHWLKMGAKPSATIHNLLVAEKILDSPKVRIFNVSKKAKAEAEKAKAVAMAEKAPVPAVQTPAQPAGASAQPAEIKKEEQPAKKPAEPEKTA